MTANLVALVLVLATMAVIVVVTLRTGAPPLPTSPAVRKAMLDMLSQALAGPVHELGSGWGGLALALARRYPEAQVVGYELSPLPWAFSRLRKAFSRVPNLEFRLGDFLAADHSGAGLVVCFLATPLMERLKPKLESELAPGALVLSNTFAIRGWNPVDVSTVADVHRSRIYLYRMGSHRAPDAATPGLG